MTPVATVSIVNPRHVAYVGALRSSGDASGDAWFTPPEIINVVKRILVGIELDPFSSDEANEKYVKAKSYFTWEDDAFSQPWKARSVFMNPPYSRGLCAKAVGKFLHEYERGHFRTGIVLVNNMTDTIWFHELAKVSRRRCDLKGRISFVALDGKRVSGNTRGQTMFFLSHRNNAEQTKRFDTLMPHLGLVYGPAEFGGEK